MLCCCCYILGVLAAAEQYVELLVLLGFIEWVYGAISAREIKLIVSNLIECLRMEQLANAVTTAGEEHGEVPGQFNGEDFVLVYVTNKHGTVLLEVKLNQATTIGAVVNGLVQCAPSSAVDLVVFRRLDRLHGFDWLF